MINVPFGVCAAEEQTADRWTLLPYRKLPLGKETNTRNHYESNSKTFLKILSQSRGVKGNWTYKRWGGRSWPCWDLSPEESPLSVQAYNEAKATALSFDRTRCQFWRKRTADFYFRSSQHSAENSWSSGSILWNHNFQSQHLFLTVQPCLGYTHKYHIILLSVQQLLFGTNKQWFEWFDYVLLRITGSNRSCRGRHSPTVLFPDSPSSYTHKEKYIYTHTQGGLESSFLLHEQRTCQTSYRLCFPCFTLLRCQLTLWQCTCWRP